MPKKAVDQQSRAAAEARARLRGLKAEQARQLQRAMALLAAGDRLLAGQWLLALAREVPDHPELLRCRGLWYAAEDDWPQAAAFLARSHAASPGDFALRLQLAKAQDNAGEPAAALPSLHSAASQAHTAQEWLALTLEFDRQGYLQEALHAVNQLLRLDPRSAIGLLQRARCCTAMGQADQAAADCRALIASRQLLARAWFMLGDLKIVKLSSAELASLEHTAQAPAPSVTAEERVMLLFALGKALEDAGRVEEAFAVLQRGNGLAADSRPWDAAAFRRHVAEVQAAFDSAPLPACGSQGSEVIFLVGLPRSGTTLTEQVLASHSQVEGASELPYLGQVIEAETRRRGKPFPQWVQSASADDWARMGRDYLAMSARWRTSHPVATDKLPNNWLFAAAALRMLPGARVIDCRRDPVETCWSCYKQLFGPGMVHFTYSFENLASYWHAYDALTRHWAARHPDRFYVQSYEALVANPELQIRALLAFCGLPFEPGCLHFHTAQRAIRTPSALQVRQPLRQTSTPAAGYGRLMDPLRQLLEAPREA